MKILQLIDSLHSGGAERMCVNISNMLDSSGHAVTLCASRDGGKLENGIGQGVRYKVLNKSHSADFLAFQRLVKIIRTNEIELIHAHSSSIFWAVAAKFCMKGLKVIWHDHLGLRVNERKNLHIYKLLSPKIDGIIAVNRELVDWSRKNMKVPAERIAMINNFPLNKSVARNPNPELFTIVCLANLRPQKDHETLVHAIALLKKHDLPQKLKVIFAGSLDDFNYSQRIRQLIGEFSLEDTITLTGTVEDTAALLARADCGVLSSTSEGLPVSLLEYGMAALPVVVTNVGQCADVVDHGKCGRVVNVGAPEAFAEELFWMIDNRDLASEIGKALKEKVGKEYGPQQFLSEYEALLQKISVG